MTERNSFHDLETRSPVPITNGSHAYAEKAEIMLWAYAGDEGEPRVWDRLNRTDNYLDELSDSWVEVPLNHQAMPGHLCHFINDDECLVWFHNGGMFDFVVIDKTLPVVGQSIPMHRRRDTMVQAYAHSLPGALDKLGEILKLVDGDRKLDEGKKLIRLFCIPKADGTYNDKKSHPAEWQRFIVYAARDITTMRAAHRKMPTWNYKTGKQVELWHLHLKMNYGGVRIDQELAAKAIEAADKAKRDMAKRTVELTDGGVGSTTQRDLLLKWILESHGVELPDMRADTLERRLEDPELPDTVKELLRIRLRASMNSATKYKTALRIVSADGRFRGGSQFRGAGRTGRTGHRAMQYGNMPRPAYSWKFIEQGIAAIKAGCLDLVVENEMEMLASSVRGVIVASEGNKLCIADLSNIEGRMAAWLAGEDWKIQAFRDFDTIIPGEVDKKGKPKRKGLDLYVRAYMASFNVDRLSDDPHEYYLQRQIGKVEELMFQYGGGVGAWITGAATYGIDLVAMADAVHDTIDPEVLEAARGFLDWQYSLVDEKHDMMARKAAGDAQRLATIEASRETAKVKARFGLSEKVFVVCDSLKRLWRAAHPRISSYWPELEETIREAIANLGVTFRARKLKIRRDGSWLRIGLPSGRALCYPGIHLTKDGSIAYTGQNQYSRAWGEVRTYGGKIFENVVQAAACDQFMEVLPMLDAEGYLDIGGFDVHDEWVCETPDDDRFSSQRLAEIMVSPLDWNDGLPLAAAGFETYRYRKDD
jgi:DNA polymerase